MQISKYFLLQEFICPEIYTQFGNNSIWFLDPKIVSIADFIREGLNRPVVINNWHFGGKYKESGLRSMGSLTGGKFSQHKYGRAIDIKIKGLTPVDVLAFIHDKWDELKELGLTTIEDIQYTPTWNHLDCRVWGDEELHVVKP